MFGHSDVPLFVSAQPVLMGFFLSSTGSWGPFQTPRASLRTASPLHAPFKPRRDPTILLWHRPSTFPLESNSAPAQSVDLHSSDCASSVFGESSRGAWSVFHSPIASWRMRGPHRQPVAEGLRRYQNQILTTISAFLLSGNMWPVREEAHSFSVTPVSCVTKRVEDIMPALEACHARESERAAISCH